MNLYMSKIRCELCIFSHANPVTFGSCAIKDYSPPENVLKNLCCNSAILKHVGVDYLQVLLYFYIAKTIFLTLRIYCIKVVDTVDYVLCIYIEELCLYMHVMFYRVQVVHLTTMFSGMTTTSQLMNCSLSLINSVTLMFVAPGLSQSPPLRIMPT